MKNKNTNGQIMVRVYTQKEVAEALNLCVETVSRWTTAEIIPCHRVGRVVRYDLSAVLAAIEKTAKKRQVNK